MTDPITTLLEDLQIARTSEPLLLSQPPQQTPAAILYSRAMEGIRQLKRRVSDLLEANTRYLLRARAGEALLLRVATCQTLVCEEDAKLHDEIREFLKQPWKMAEHKDQ